MESKVIFLYNTIRVRKSWNEGIRICDILAAEHEK